MATPIRSPISPMSGHSPAIRVLAIRTGSWLAPEARPETRRLPRLAFGLVALVCSLAPVDALAARYARSQRPSHPPSVRHLPYPPLELPFQIAGGQYAPVAWSEVTGWNEDDHLAAYNAFRVSCKPISAQRKPPADPKTLGSSVRDPRHIANGLEMCWLKEPTDLLFSQIQGSARVSLDDGSTVRINYDAHNGYPYTAVGRILIERNIIPRDQMSMQKIREWMEQNPNEADELRRQNKSYVFFREVQLSDKDEAVGAQGVALTPGRSIAGDKSLHVYCTPFFIEGELPIESEQSKTPFRRLMIAQDTGSAIVGPARADLYFGAGADAGRVSGRLRHNMRFGVLGPQSLDPAARGRRMPGPDERPSEKIAKLFPQVDPPKDQQRDQKNGANPPETSAAPGA